jgi:hypothetical protein
MRRHRTLAVTVALVMMALATAWAALRIRESREIDGYLSSPTKHRNQPPLSTYEAEIRRLLLTSKGDIARMLVEPAFRTESSVAISSNDSAGRGYVLTCQIAKRSIWNTVASDLSGDEAASARLSVADIARTDVPIPTEIAAEVHGAWLAMLRLPRHRPTLVADGETYTFSIVDDATRVEMSGVAWSPRPGRLSDMAAIGAELIEYCRADESIRRVLAATITERARNLRHRARVASLTTLGADRDE